MQPHQPLVMAALVMSVLSTTLSIVALWPHLKDRLSVVRDVVLWIAVVGVAVTIFLSHQKGSRAEQHGFESRSLGQYSNPPPIPEVRSSWPNSSLFTAPATQFTAPVTHDANREQR